MSGDWRRAVWRFAFVGGDSRADKRRAAVAKSDAQGAAPPLRRRRSARKKQIADGLRELERRERRRANLATRIEQAGTLDHQASSIGSG